MAKKPKTEDAAAATDAPKSGIAWREDKMQTQYANVVNVQSTREQVDLFFGTNQTWNISSEPKLAVDLSNRVILTPHAAKRLWAVLGGVLREYEQRYGVLTVDRS